MFEPERQAIRQIFKLPRATMRESMILAAIYAAQAMTCAALLTLAYHSAGTQGLGWAIISAIIVLQPGIQASLAASISRILANIVGAIVAVAVERSFGGGLWQLLIAIPLIVLICEILRLDMGLRAACVSAVIVMTFSEGRIVTTSVERSVAVMLGSTLAVIVQFAGARLKHWIFGPNIDLSAPPEQKALN